MNQELEYWLEKRWLPLQLFVAGVVILLLTGWLWWAKVSVHPARVFNEMLRSSLSTSGVTVTLEQKGETETIKQAIQLQLGAENFARSLTTVSRDKDIVTTETLGTQDGDYTRYTQIKTSKAGPDGKPVNTANLVNVWAKTTDGETPETQSPSLFKQAVFGQGLPLGTLPVPTGQLSSERRNALLEQIKQDNVYDIDFTKAKKRTVNGRLAYAYEVALQPILYARMMQTFVQNMGLDDLKDLDPNSFSGAQPLKMTLIVDAHARQLVQVEYPNKNFKETFSGYGVRTKLEVPRQTIPASELQQRLSVLQN